MVTNSAFKARSEQLFKVQSYVTPKRDCIKSLYFMITASKETWKMGILLHSSLIQGHSQESTDKSRSLLTTFLTKKQSCMPSFPITLIIGKHENSLHEYQLASG